MDKEHIPEVWLADGGVFMVLSLLMIWLVFSSVSGIPYHIVLITLIGWLLMLVIWFVILLALIVIFLVD